MTMILHRKPVGLTGLFSYLTAFTGFWTRALVVHCNLNSFHVWLKLKDFWEISDQKDQLLLRLKVSNLSLSKAWPTNTITDGLFLFTIVKMSFYVTEQNWWPSGWMSTWTLASCAGHSFKSGNEHLTNTKHCWVWQFFPDLMSEPNDKYLTRTLVLTPYLGPGCGGSSLSR